MSYLIKTNFLGFLFPVCPEYCWILIVDQKIKIDIWFYCCCCSSTRFILEISYEINGEKKMIIKIQKKKHSNWINIEGKNQKKELN